MSQPRPSRLLFKITVLLILLLGGGAALYFTYGQSYLDRREFRRNAIDLLTSSTDPAVLGTKLRGDGIVFTYPDGWIAIRAGGMDDWGPWSLTLARDSQGKLYESERRMIGLFHEYRMLSAQLDSASGSPATQPTAGRAERRLAELRELAALGRAADLNAARAHLGDLGFRETQP